MDYEKFKKDNEEYDDWNTDIHASQKVPFHWAGVDVINNEWLNLREASDKVNSPAHYTRGTSRSY